MTGETRLQLALAAATTLAGSAVLPLTQDRLFLVQLAVMVLVSVGIGAGVRALRAPDWLARLFQLAPGLVAVWWQWEEWPELIDETAAFVANAYAPMPGHEGFRVLSVGVLWLLFVVAEAVAAGLNRPGWTFPVLALPYLVPAIALNDETSPWYLAPACAGYLLVLATAVYNRVAPDLRTGRRRLAGGIALTGTLVGVAAWTLSGLVSLALPERGTALLDPSRLDTSVQLGDPTLDLVRNLRAPTGRDIIGYTSSDGQGHYLRLAALPAFDRTGFHLVATDLLPGLPDLADGVDTDPVTLSIRVDGFASEWLPVPWMPQSFQAAGEWRHDPATGAIVAVGSNRGEATRGLDYLVDARLMQPGPEAIAAAGPGTPGDGGLTLALPEELDPRVIDLAAQVTAGATTAGERTLALARWLRSEEFFTYSTATVEGSTLDTVSDFLLVSRTGYCEQFAGSLAILARAVGVPSRVVVGFLPGKPTDDGYVVSTKDMHAWTEVFLEGLGWVSIDPTPSGAPGALPVPSATPTPSVPTSAGPTIDDVPTAPARPNPEDPSEPTAGTSFQLPGWAGWLAAGLAAALVPAGLRRFRTWRRLRPGAEPARAAEAAWDEIRDTVLDLGRPWPRATPRQAAAELSVRLDPAAAAALATLGRQVERARFAPATDDAVDPGQVRRITAALELAAPIQPVLSHVLPRSLFHLSG